MYVYSSDQKAIPYTNSEINMYYIIVHELLVYPSSRGEKWTLKLCANNICDWIYENRVGHNVTRTEIQIMP